VRKLCQRCALTPSPGSRFPPEATWRAVEEYLAVLDDAAFDAATEIAPEFVSPADPAARWIGAHGRQAFFTYSTNYLIDVENAIIVDVKATTAIRKVEVLAAKRMIARSMDRFSLYPAQEGFCSGTPERSERDPPPSGNTVAANHWCFRCCRAAKDCADRRNRPARWW
jgi:hypothetical protein